jgi:HSP20 family protein
VARLADVETDRSLAADVRRLLADLGSAESPDACRVPTGECAPPLDVYETDGAFAIEMEAPGLSIDDLRILARDSVVVIAGVKRPPACADADRVRFHLAERAFGHFARVARLDAAVDIARAEATLSSGLLRLVVPKVDERRGRDVSIPIAYRR